MKLSIIIPVYNVEEYIDECLNSVKDLKELDYEIVIVNDGSTDNSLSKIIEFEKSYNGNLKIINQENKGLSGARNTGIKNSSGDYIFFLDSDDFIIKEKFIEFIKEVEKDNVDIGFGDYDFYIDGKFENNPYLEYRRKMNESCNEILDGLTYAEKNFDRNKDFLNVEACMQIISKKFIEDNGILFKEGIYHEDVLFTYQELLKARKVKFYKTRFYAYRQRSGSIMNSQNKKVLDKRVEDKFYLAKQLYEIKIENCINAYFWDTMIIDLLFFVVVSNKKHKDYDREILRKCKKLIVKAKIKSLLIRIVS